MPGSLRRSRIVALLLLLLTPGLGGWVVQAAHPCPAAAAAVGHAAHGQSHHDIPADGEHDGHCRCIGSCHAAQAVQSADAPTFDVAPAAYHPTPHRPDGALLLPAGRPPQLLPPATAPPVLS
jgi:hypothetical protein